MNLIKIKWHFSEIILYEETVKHLMYLLSRKHMFCKDNILVNKYKWLRLTVSFSCMFVNMRMMVFTYFNVGFQWYDVNEAFQCHRDQTLKACQINSPPWHVRKHDSHFQSLQEGLQQRPDHALPRPQGLCGPCDWQRPSGRGGEHWQGLSKWQADHRATCLLLPVKEGLLS